ncbi:N-acetylmuramoyl-L-alanine amidase [Lysinibacillus sp. NPDC096418]|uniref:N-acetylmuramoyl-L-alanine amidase n=1 Tax=Lysinibacillus sp. NPDC096418 TaxID=3364138 RepID=UPI003817AA3D
MIVKEIEIHPGHWKNTGSGANGILNEVTEARKVAKRVYEILRSWKVPTTYFEDNTSTNQTQNINALVNEHNKDKDGLIVSIHFNAGGDGSKAIGTEVLYYDQKALATRISKAISDATGGGLLNRGAKQRTDLGVLARTYEPAILIEVCFVNSTVDAAIYRHDFEKICQAIAKELAAYLGKSAPSTSSPVEEKKEEVKMEFLNETGRAEIRALLKKARNKTYVVEGKTKNIIDPSTHTDAKINAYTDVQLLSYQAAVTNRTF